MNSIEIKKASFVYETKEKKEKEVLFVKNLEIKQGDITFIIGVSGAGKSTLLESIGLMNKTISTTNSVNEMSLKFLYQKDVNSSCQDEKNFEKEILQIPIFGLKKNI